MANGRTSTLTIDPDYGQPSAPPPAVPPTPPPPQPGSLLIPATDPSGASIWGAMLPGLSGGLETGMPGGMQAMDIYGQAGQAMGGDIADMARGIWFAGPGTTEQVWTGQLPPGAPETEQAARQTAAVYGTLGTPFAASEGALGMQAIGRRAPVQGDLFPLDAAAGEYQRLVGSAMPDTVRDYLRQNPNQTEPYLFRLRQMEETRPGTLQRQVGGQAADPATQHWVDTGELPEGYILQPHPGGGYRAVPGHLATVDAIANMYQQAFGHSLPDFMREQFSRDARSARLYGQQLDQVLERSQPGEVDPSYQTTAWMRDLSPEARNRVISDPNTPQAVRQALTEQINRENIRDVRREDIRRSLGGTPMAGTREGQVGTRIGSVGERGPQTAPEGLRLSEEGSYDPGGGDRRRFHIQDPAGREHGLVDAQRITDPQGRPVVYISWVGAQGESWNPGAWGHANTRALLRQLKAEFPGTVGVFGNRISGAREAVGQTGYGGTQWQGGFFLPFDEDEEQPGG